jgi:hypothetical protein
LLDRCLFGTIELGAIVSQQLLQQKGHELVDTVELAGESLFRGRTQIFGKLNLSPIVHDSRFGFVCENSANSAQDGTSNQPVIRI